LSCDIDKDSGRETNAITRGHLHLKTLTSREICERLADRIGSFVSEAFDAAPTEFKALYRNKASVFPGGFRRIDLVPKAVMTKTIVRDCVVDPAVALTVFRNWYRAKAELRDTAAALLNSLGYQVVEPDFEQDSIAHQSLASKHIRLDDNAYYFTPGEGVAQFDKLELTVMVALLGWFPDPEE
jgi:hypothetical protein